jgi:hypothetical protein
VKKNRPDVTNPDKVFGVRQLAAALQMQRRDCDGSTCFATDQRRFCLKTYGTQLRIFRLPAFLGLPDTTRSADGAFICISLKSVQTVVFFPLLPSFYSIFRLCIPAEVLIRNGV